MGKLLLVVGMINNNLKRCREELEMTQEELGFVFGVTKNTVSGWENSHDSIPLQKLVKFSNLYKFSLDFIVGLKSHNSNYKVIEKPNKQKIGENLKVIRKKLNLTQKQIADECMISQGAYSGYESGKYLITTLTLYTICYNHKISLYDILK